MKGKQELKSPRHPDSLHPVFCLTHLTHKLYFCDTSPPMLNYDFVSRNKENTAFVLLPHCLTFKIDTVLEFARKPQLVECAGVHECD